MHKKLFLKQKMYHQVHHGGHADSLHNSFVKCLMQMSLHLHGQCSLYIKTILFMRIITKKGNLWPSADKNMCMLATI